MTTNQKTRKIIVYDYAIAYLQTITFMLLNSSKVT